MGKELIISKTYLMILIINKKSNDIYHKYYYFIYINLARIGIQNLFLFLPCSSDANSTTLSLIKVGTLQPIESVTHAQNHKYITILYPHRCLVLVATAASRRS
jgi:hypothetical protein